MTTAVVVGGGLAGLSCAVALSDRGVGVTVLEAGARLGGRASSWPATSGSSAPVDEMTRVERRPQLRLALLLALCGALATVSVLPYLFAMQPALAARIPVSLPVFALAQFVQGGALLLLLGWVGLRCGAAAGLDAPFLRALAYRTAMPAFRPHTWLLACAVGLLAGALIRVLDLGFQDYLPPASAPALDAIAFWKRALATLYGAITEELVCRLFLMTLVVWAALKLSGRRGAPGIGIILLGVLAAALLFGLLHLPAMAQVWPLTPVVVSRALLLNAIGGIAFGILYWHYGLEHAMAAHLFADIAVHLLAA